MAGDNDKKTPSDFNECVSREGLEVVQKKMEETVNKAVHDTLIAMKLGIMLERVDRRLSELTKRIAALEIRPPPQPEDTGPPPYPDDAVFDANGNYDVATTKEARLRRRLRINMAGMNVLKTISKVITIVSPMTLMAGIPLVRSYITRRSPGFTLNLINRFLNAATKSLDITN